MPKIEVLDQASCSMVAAFARPGSVIAAFDWVVEILISQSRAIGGFQYGVELLDINNAACTDGRRWEGV